MTQHSVYSFSSSSRWIEGACPASIRMSKGIPGSTNPAAELGTAAHELGEFCITFGLAPYECLGMTFNKHIVDDNMAENVAVYVGFVRDLQTRLGYRAKLEERVVMSSLGRTDVYGTSDCTLIAGNTLHVVDYKHGYGIVESQGNPQLAGYGVATLDTFNLWGQIKNVHVTIVQPRASHIDGPIRTASYTIAEMHEWQQRFGRSIILCDDRNQRPSAGKHCKYCPARGHCRARMERTLQFAYTDCPMDELSPGEIEVLFEEMDGIKTHLEAVAGKALELGRNGHGFEKYKLVNSIVRAKCHDEKALVEDAIAQGVDRSKLYEEKLVSMTKAKKALPYELVAKHYIKPSSSTTLVPLTDNRPAIRVGSAKGVFTSVQTSPSAAGVFGAV